MDEVVGLSESWQLLLKLPPRTNAAKVSTVRLAAEQFTSLPGCV